MMKRVGLALAIWASLSLAAVAQVGGLSFPGPGPRVASVGGFQGPGDVTSVQALSWVGLRAYNAAYAAPGTNPSLQVCDTATGLTCSTINILTTGYADRATAVASAACAVQCSAFSFTDQTGNGRPLLQANQVIAPVVLFSGCPTTFQMCLQTTAASNTTMASSATFTQAQPFTMSAVAERYANFAANNNIMMFDAGSAEMGFSSTANKAYLLAGSALPTATANDNALHALQGTFNGASSSLYVDGTNTALATPGTGGASANTWGIGDDGAGQHPSIYFYEGGFYAGAMSTADKAALNANQHGSTGWNF